MKLKIFNLFIILVLFAGCGDSGTETSGNDNEIIPLAIGNTWIYKVYNIHSSNKDSLLLSDTITMTITYKINIDGEDWYYINESEKSLFTNRSSGLWILEFDDTTNIDVSKAMLYYKYPTVVGDRFPTDTAGAQTVSTSYKVVCGAGTFNCIRYVDIKEHIFENNGYFFKAGVGMVRQEVITHIDTNRVIPDTIWIRMDLESYSLK